MGVIAPVLTASIVWLARLVLGALFAQQVKGSLPEYTARRARAAAEQLPDQLRERYEEEWLAELDAQREKPLSALRFAHSLSKAARAISAQAGGNIEAEATAKVARVADTLVAGLLLLLFAPMLGVVAALVKVGSDGRILDRSHAFGRGGAAIELLSFSKRTGRVGAVGAFLWRSGLDQLPVLINVIRGEIALIGPPPLHRVGVRLEPPKLVVRPGLASWRRLAEVGSVKIGLDEARHRDESRSLRNDLALLANLPRFMLRAEPIGVLAEQERRYRGAQELKTDELR